MLRPLIVVTDMQESILKPEGFICPHLDELAQSVGSFIGSRHGGTRTWADIAWVCHSYDKDARLPGVMRDISEFRKHLTFPGDAIDARMAPRDGDYFLLKTKVGMDFAPHIPELGLHRRPIGLCGAYLEECVLSGAFDLHDHQIQSTILIDQSDNFSAKAKDHGFAKSMEYWSKARPLIHWKTSSEWMEDLSNNLSSERPNSHLQHKVPDLIS